MTAPAWTGSAAEWDAELTARMNRLVEANFTAGSRSVRYVATATMPPRPVEPPIICGECECEITNREHLTYRGGRPYHNHWISCVTTLKRALRDGPAPRYEVCGWGVTREGIGTNTWALCGDVSEKNAKAFALQYGGTAHPIYRRVDEGAK